MSEALEMFGAGGGWDDFIDQTLPDTVLMFCDWQIKIPETHSLQSLESEIQAWAEQFKPAFSKLKPKGYPVIASIPPRFFFIASVEENVLQTIAEKGTAAMGGPGRGLFAVKRVVKI
ncbi:uncharacterized protein LOC143294756 [Babylonia areolata]|uniref:uncharacterized protein LOC143294756 n=1 Tax=Babylonia areolata TaxID=304850 RepID=UPI003FCF5D90